MKDVVKQRVYILILSITTALSIFFLPRITNTPEEKIDSNAAPKVSVETTYRIELNNDKIVLMRDNTLIKEYDVNISLLPGEDILILTEGVSFSSLREAEAFMEDYDS